jgi:hypothetical protein
MYRTERTYRKQDKQTGKKKSRKVLEKEEAPFVNKWSLRRVVVS